ncbi:MAG: CBS domain-containing protein [Planctomycetota bacterium]|jgi:CBS domain-containing protein
MATAQTEVESQAIELATEAFKTFCDDMSGMFGVDMQCEQQEVAAETVAGLKKRFKKLVAVNVVDSKGLLDGTFQLVFDQEGLFTLGGVIVMLPEQRIMANRRDASVELAESMIDAVGEAGNLLIGSWDKVFREGLDGHGHFLQRLPAFIGKPWDKPEEKIGLASDGELVFIPYEMTIGSYPAFNCGVIFPKTILGGNSDSASEEAAATDENAQEETEDNTQDTQPATERTDSEESDKVQESDSEGTKPQEPAVEKVPAEQTDAKDSAEEAGIQQTSEDKADSEETGAAQESDGEETEPQEPAVEETPAEQTDAKESAEEAGAQQVSEDKADSEETATAQESDGEETKPQEPAVEEVPAEQTDAKESAEETGTQQTSEDEADSEETAAAQESDSEKPEPQEPDVSVEEEDAAPEANAADDAAEEEAAADKSKESAMGRVSETIRKMAQSPAVLPGESGQPTTAKNAALSNTSELLWICAKDIMQKQVIWASPDETVQQALAKMQQHDAGYMMIGQDGIVEGIVSKSDIAGAMSPYLRPIFAKWRGHSDDATLKIKVKWIMSRPVRTVRPETSLGAIMENMCRFGGRALPVVGKQAKVQGLVTAFDIFRMLLSTSTDISTAGKTPQGPPLA